MTLRSPAHAGRSLRPPRRPWEPRSWVAVGHRSAGKTSLAEIVLHAGRVIRQPGEIHAGSTLLDWTPESMAHEQTLGVSTAWIDIDDDTPMVWVDTPGTLSLRHEQDRALHLADGALLVVDGTKGIEHGTARVVPHLKEDRPCVVAVTKADRGLDIEDVWRLCDELTDRLGRRVAALQLPWVERGELIGLIDLLERRALRYDPERTGAWSPEPIPAALKDVVWSAAESIAEAVALTDDDLLEQYLEDLELPWPVVELGLQEAVRQGTVVPLVITSAAQRIGGKPLLSALGRFQPPHRPVAVRDSDGQTRPCAIEDGFVATVVSSGWDKEGKPFHMVRVCHGAPSRRPVRNLRTGDVVKVAKWYRLRGPRRAVVQRPGRGAWIACYDNLDLQPGDTLAEQVEVALPMPDPPVVAWWIPDDQAPGGTRERLATVAKLDPGLVVEETGAGVQLWGISEGHLQLALQRTEAWLGAPVPVYLPPVPYREVVAGPVSDVSAVLRKTGDHGLVDAFAEIHVSLAPGDPNQGLVFHDAVKDAEALPQRFRPAVQRGVARGCAKGPQGYPVTGVMLTLSHGEYDILCSTDDHFEQVGATALAKALERAGTEFVEPVCTASISVPQDCTGDVIADVAAHRGRVLALETTGCTTTLDIEQPLRELRTLPRRLSGLTGGRGDMRWELSHYRKVDKAHVATQREPCRPTLRR
ncbi:MAG: GTP-binding protein [Myxococcota bacterium]